MAVDNSARDVDELAIGGARAAAQHFESGCLVDGVALHQDPFCALGDGATTERSFEVAIVAEAAQHYVDRALPVLVGRCW